MAKIGRLPNFKIHKIWKAQGLNHLFFVEDLMIFYKGNKQSVKRAKEASDHFSRVTGLSTNKEKSSLYVAGVTDKQRQKLV